MFFCYFGGLEFFLKGERDSNRNAFPAEVVNIVHYIEFFRNKICLNKRWYKIVIPRFIHLNGI